MDIVKDSLGRIFLDANGNVLISNAASFYYPSYIDLLYKAGDFDKSTGSAYWWRNSAEKSRKYINSFDYTTNRVNCTAHGFSNNETLLFALDDSGTLPSGLSKGQIYFIVNKATDYFQVAITNGGAAVSLINNGSGLNSFFPNVQYNSTLVNQPQIISHDSVGQKGINIAKVSGIGTYMTLNIGKSIKTLFIVGKRVVSNASNLVWNSSVASIVSDTLTSSVVLNNSWKNNLSKSTTANSIIANENYIYCFEYATSQLLLQLSRYGDGASSFTNYIFEIIGINRNLTLQERNYIFNMLSNKFAKPLDA